MVCCWLEGGPNSEAFKKHVARVEDYIWIAEDGMKIKVYNNFLIELVIISSCQVC